jgi:DNA replication protein DnaC
MSLHHPQLELLADAIYDASARLFYKRPGKLLILCGANGSGKTHAAKALHRWFKHCRTTIGPVATITQEGEPDCRIPDSTYVNWPAVVAGFKQDQWLIMDALMNDYYVTLDDIGAEHDPSGIAAEKLYLILSRREHKHTLITTNVSPDQFQNRFDRRIASRLFRNSIDIDLSDVPDFSLR